MELLEEIIDTETNEGEMAIVVKQPAGDPDGGGAWPTVVIFHDGPGIRNATAAGIDGIQHVTMMGDDWSWQFADDAARIPASASPGVTNTAAQ